MQSTESSRHQTDYPFDRWTPEDGHGLCNAALWQMWFIRLSIKKTGEFTQGCRNCSGTKQAPRWTGWRCRHSCWQHLPGLREPATLSFRLRADPLGRARSRKSVFPEKSFSERPATSKGGAAPWPFWQPALIETGSRMDGHWFTKNSKERAIWKSIWNGNCRKPHLPCDQYSSFRNEKRDLLLSEEEISSCITGSEKHSTNLGTINFTDTIIQNMSKTKIKQRFCLHCSKKTMQFK